MGLFSRSKKNNVDEVLFVDDFTLDGNSVAHFYTFKVSLNEARSIAEFTDVLKKLHESIKHKWLELNAVEKTGNFGKITYEDEREQSIQLTKEIRELEKKQEEFKKTYDNLISGKAYNVKFEWAVYQNILKSCGGVDKVHHGILNTDFTPLK